MLLKLFYISEYLEYVARQNSQGLTLIPFRQPVSRPYISLTGLRKVNTLHIFRPSHSGATRKQTHEGGVFKFLRCLHEHKATSARSKMNRQVERQDGRCNPPTHACPTAHNRSGFWLFAAHTHPPGTATARNTLFKFRRPRLGLEARSEHLPAFERGASCYSQHTHPARAEGGHARPRAKADVRNQIPG
jgi:hypothetical protein